jgi:protein-S-isoprenylcysteine O-methyltransferase Ste14
MVKAKNKVKAGHILAATFYILLFPTLLFLLSGDWLWPEGWIWTIWFLSLCFAATSYLYRKDPSLLAERFKKPGTGNQPKWDRYFVAGLVAAFWAWMVLMPLDAKRYGWTLFLPLGVKVLGGIGLLMASFFLYRAYTDNTFLSPLVRIQKERKQKVVSTGVYGFVRHPMYLGASLMFIGTPFLLGSFYGFLLGAGMSFLLAGRILGEEKMLARNLIGYGAYQKKVKYRLVPYVW